MKPRISWNNFFLAICKLCASRSEDPNTKVGACVVNNLHQIVSTGYNGLPRGLDSSDYPWTRTGADATELKYTYLVHAELNALTSANTSVRNCYIYITLFPCSSCTKIIIQSGIKKVLYISDQYNHLPDGIASIRMLNDAGIETIHLGDVDVQITVTSVDQ